MNVHGIQQEKKQTTTSFPCELCDKHFKRKYHLLRHKSKVHQSTPQRKQQRQFSCRHCECEFQSYDMLFHQVTQRHHLSQQGGRRAEPSRTLVVNEPSQNENEQQIKISNDVFDDISNNQRHFASVHESTDESALNNGVQNRYIYPAGSERYDMMAFFVKHSRSNYRISTESCKCT